MDAEDSISEKLKRLDNIISELVGFKQEISALMACQGRSQTTIDTLRESERNYREVIENLPQRISIKDNNLVYRFCNRRYAEDLNIQTNEIVGKSDLDFYPKELAAKYFADEQRIIDTGKSEEIEDRLIISGQEMTILSTKIPLRDAKGSVTSILTTFWNISERKRAEAESKKYISRLKDLVFERRAQIESLNDQLNKELAERKRLDEELQKIRDSLEEGSLRNVRQIQIAK